MGGKPSECTMHHERGRRRGPCGWCRARHSGGDRNKHFDCNAISPDPHRLAPVGGRQAHDTHRHLIQPRAPNCTQRASPCPSATPLGGYLAASRRFWCRERASSWLSSSRAPAGCGSLRGRARWVAPCGAAARVHGRGWLLRRPWHTDPAIALLLGRSSPVRSPRARPPPPPSASRLL